ncbi:hypothetical protein [Megasphaera cerevisiae]|uniref:hypothetical protein n=1 Tax=Megasphaera cerevisiae TaxID=39029 RepID=UPI0009451646|nr:hypothetical protein [Megasphaera cerevisiae]OKY52463.1 hypothetical protein BSR42_12655 [Megasphaera cerevisiae]
MEVQRRLNWGGGGYVRASWNREKCWNAEKDGQQLLDVLTKIVNCSLFKTKDILELDFMFPIEQYVKHIYPLSSHTIE